MEDALALTPLTAKIKNFYVLILVLMEDALALIISFACIALLFGLNPCFNGRCTRTKAYFTYFTFN